MKMKVKGIIAAAAMAVSVSLGGITASAATQEDVIAAARAAGIRSTYISFLENWLIVNKPNSNQCDMIIDGLGDIRSYNIEIAQRMFPEVESWDDFFGEGTAEPSGGDDNTDDNTNPSGPANTTKPPKEIEDFKDFIDKIEDDMTNDDMLNIIDKVISTGKELGLDISVEQTGEKSFNLTVKDKDGNVQLVMPIGKLVSTTGMQPDYDDNGFMTVAALCASLFAAGGIGAWLIARKNKTEE